MTLPKHFQVKETTRSRSSKQESRIAKDLKGRTTINSGATFNENDVVTDFCEVEAKTTTKNSFSIKADDWKLLKQKCNKHKFPIVVVDFEVVKQSVVMMDYKDFLYMVQKLNE
jgi:hypothetical protein